MKKIELRLIFLIGLSTLFSSISAFAEFWIRTSKSPYEVHLEASHCKELEKAISGLEAWSKIFKPGKVQKTNCFGTNGHFSANVTHLIPAHVLELMAKGKNLQCSGPNCFNTALFSAGFSIYPRFTSSEEARGILNKCKVRSAGTSPRPGDVAVIVNPLNQDYEHLFIHIGGGLVLSKNGFDQRHELKLETFETVATLYRVPQEKSCLFKWKSRSRIQPYIQYYDCTNQKKDLNYPPEWRDLEEKLSCYIYSTSFSSEFAVLEELLKKLVKLDKSPPITNSLVNQLFYSKLQHAFLDPSTIDDPTLLRAQPLDETLLTRTLDQPITPETTPDRMEKIKILIGKGADPNHKDRKGRLPLRLAKTIEEIRFLLDHGANVNGNPQDFITPLMAAILKKDLHITEVLLEYKARTQGPEMNNKNVLEWAKDTLKDAPEDFFERLNQLLHRVAPESFAQEPISLTQPTVKHERESRFIDSFQPVQK